MNLDETIAKLETRLWLKRSLFLLVVGTVKAGLERSIDQFNPADEKDVS